MTPTKSKNCTSNCRRFLFDVLEKPWSGQLARLYALFSLVVVVLSTATFILSTLEELQMKYPAQMKFIDALDTATVAVFTLEYFTRLCVSPNKVGGFSRFQCKI